LANELEKAGSKMNETLARLHRERMAQVSTASAGAYAAAVSRPVVLEWGMCAMYDLPFVTHMERQASGLYLVKECVRVHGNEGGGAAGADAGRSVPLDRVIGSPLPCPWCGANRGHYHCDCGAVVCGGKVDERRNKFYCRVSCGRSWEIGRDAKETRVSETRRGGDWQPPQRSGAWQAPPQATNPARLLLPPVKGRR
jgi:hypothetical protein